jgi:hypothetical protein
MKVSLFTLCDAATEWYGKLNILGPFDTIYSPQTPTVHPACAVVTSLKFEPIEEGIHRIKLRFGDADGREILQAVEMQLNVILPPGAQYLTANSIFNLQQLKLPRFGEYSVDLAVGGKQEGSLSLFVQEVKPNRMAA